jgi:hypothetical protein
MKRKWMLFLAIPAIYLLTTGQSCNDCALDTDDLTKAQTELASYSKSKQLKVAYNSSKKSSTLTVPADCNCFYTGEDFEAASAENFGIQKNPTDPLMLSPISKGNTAPTLDPSNETFSRILNEVGCPSCTGGTTGGGVRPPKPPVPPVGDDEFGFDKGITTFSVGANSSLGGKSDFLEASLITKSALGRPNFSDLVPADGWKGTTDGREYFYTNRNGYMVAVIDLGDEGVLRLGSFNGERVQWVIKNFDFY